MIKPSVQERIQQLLSSRVGVHVEVISVRSVGGGSINEAYQLITNSGTFFVKVNSASKFPSMFKKEALGLEALAATNTIHIPNVIGFSEEGEDAFLLLDWVEKGTTSTSFWEDFGHQLGQLHKCTHTNFGWTNDNYIGSLVQYNSWTKSWSSFFIEQRIDPQLKLAVEKGLIDAHKLESFHQLYKQIENIFPNEPPALLHGDLWSGNYMVTAAGEPMIMDPAVYYGHREMDIAMTQLFGGFDGRLYEAYNEEYPLNDGWQDRMTMCNLYPLLVHVNLFGSSYLSQVNAVLKQYS